MPGTLFLVATPIGNLADITLRALECLRTVDLIACEDTRHTQKLLKHYDISAKLVSYHEHNEEGRSEELIDRLKKGDSVAVVSDAGTPGICDPGFRIVQHAIEDGVEIISLPGACAFALAAANSGLGTDAIFFGGFLPARTGERRRKLTESIDIPATLVFYETPHRIASSLRDCESILGDRNAAVARELTKLHEETLRGTLGELARHFAAATPKGEFVVVIERAQASDLKTASDTELFLQRVEELVKSGMERRPAMRKAAKEHGLTRSEAYRLLQTSG